MQRLKINIHNAPAEKRVFLFYSPIFMSALILYQIEFLSED